MEGIFKDKALVLAEDALMEKLDPTFAYWEELTPGFGKKNMVELPYEK